MKKLIAPFLVLLVVGCATGADVVPMTGVQRYVVADAQFKGVLLSVQDMVVRGYIKGEAATRVRGALAITKIALDAWAVVPEDRNVETTAILALTSLRSLLRAVTPNPGG